MKTNIIGLKELREHTQEYVAKIEKGQSFLVMRKSKPLFKISPAEEDDNLWEEAIDFTKIKRGGVSLSSILSRI